MRSLLLAALLFPSLAWAQNPWIATGHQWQQQMNQSQPGVWMAQVPPEAGAAWAASKAAQGVGTTVNVYTNSYGNPYTSGYVPIPPEAYKPGNSGMLSGYLMQNRMTERLNTMTGTGQPLPQPIIIINRGQ